MTVRELIAALGAFDPEAEVSVWDAYDDAERAPEPKLEPMPYDRTVVML